MEYVHGTNCFTMTFFQLDSYITKPDLILDETYSNYRNCNINLATIIRLYGKTFDGISICCHVHQYFPHLSISQKDLFECYKVDVEQQSDEQNEEIILNLFINDLENLLRNFISIKSQNEIQILNVKKFESKSFYGYHDVDDYYYRFYFTTYWMANEAKNIIESGKINNYEFMCFNFLEFLLQFYIDNNIYLNQLTFKHITFRKHFDVNNDEQKMTDFDSQLEHIRNEQCKTVEKILSFNDLPRTSTCQLECDVLAEDIVILNHEKSFPSFEDRSFQPTIPGIVSIWNRQFKRLSMDEYRALIKLLPEPNSNEFSSNEFQLRRLYLFGDNYFNQKIPQLDGTADDNGNEFESFIFNRKKIAPSGKKLRKGFVLISNDNAELLNLYKSKLLNQIDVNGQQNVINHRKNPFDRNVQLENLFTANNLVMNQSMSTTINDDSIDTSILTNVNNRFEQLDDYLEWRKYLHLTIISMELHSRIRANLCSDPNYDPIQMIMFEVLWESLDEARSSMTKSSSYSCAIIVQPNKSNRAIKLRNSQSYLTIEYVTSELDLILKFRKYVQRIDPDILIGYTVDSQSWGYLLQRSNVLALPFGPMFSRIMIPAKQNECGDINKMPHLIGRIILNTWYLLRHEISLRSYKFENVYEHLFKTKVYKLSNETIGKLWNQSLNNDISEQLLLEYYYQRTTGTLKILNQIDFIHRTYDLSIVFGMQFSDVIDRGSQFRVESLLLKLCNDENYLPIRFSKQRIQHQYAPQCLPLIFEPNNRVHYEPVAVMDFQSLYPSIMIAHNYCFSTCLGRLKSIISDNNQFGCYKLENRKEILNQFTDDQIHLSENDIIFVRSTVRRGILPKMLEEILNTRILIKNELKIVERKLMNDNLTKNERKYLKSLRNQLDNQQLAMKLISNVTYGYTSANYTGRMPCIEIADSIVSKGRQILEEVIEFINKWGQNNGTDIKVIYGDTDSVFISFPNHSLNDAFEISNFLIKEINKRQPYPICLKLEKIYKPCVIMAKKHYCGYSFESINSEPKFDAKGIETIRRDGCPLTAKMIEKCLRILFDTNGDLQSLKSYLQLQFDNLLSNRVKDLSDFIFSRRFAGFNWYHNNGNVIPTCIVARKRLEKDPRDEAKIKERVDFIIVNRMDDIQNGIIRRRIADMVEEPSNLYLNPTKLELNYDYYIKNAIILPLIRILPSFLNEDDYLNNQSIKLLNNWHYECFIRNKRIKQNLSVKNQLIQQSSCQTINFNLEKQWNYDRKSVMNTANAQHLMKILELIQKLRSKLQRDADKCQYDCFRFDWKQTLTMNLDDASIKHPCQMYNCSVLYKYHQSINNYNYLLFLINLYQSI